MKIKKYLPNILCLFLFLAYSIQAQGQKTIQHKTGAYYTGYMDNGYGKSMQKTHTYRTTVYANTNTVTLNIPPQRGGGGTPQAYFRWYNYTTDGLSANVTPGVTYTTATNGRYYFDNSAIEGQRATYNYSAGGASIVACDVSSYKDYTNGSTSLTEPTLSYRCLFDIRPASEMANKLRNLAAGKYMEESVVYMPATLASTQENPRVCLEYERTNYFGYTTSSGTTISNGTFSVTGNVADPKNRSGRFLFVQPGAAGTSKEVTVTMRCGSGSSAVTYRIAKFTIHFIADKAMTYENLTGANEKRSNNYLDKNYVLLSKLDFDYNTDPATAANNMWANPLPWDICSYGFSSEKLFNQSYRCFSNKVSQWNEYGFYKTANVALSGLASYTWYNGGFTVYDRRHFSTAGKQDGYFMYIDASDGPGVVARLALDKLCPGTKLLVSAGIASLTSNSSSNSYPDINFVFIGVDANGNETELNRYTSGDIPSTSSSPTPWYQAYYSFTYSSNIEYTSYLLQVENNCTSTSGGDYAIDDIRVYRSKPSVQANQIALPCGSEDAKVKIRVEYGKLLESLGQTEVTGASVGNLVELKYQFLDKDKASITYDYGTSSNYGRIKISTKFSDMLSTGEIPVATGESTVVAHTETEILDGISYRYIVFEAPNNQSLIPNQTYYSVVADSYGFFGTDICSLISDPFVILPPYAITVDGSPWIEGGSMCFGNLMTIGAKLRDRNHSYQDIDCRFDWYMRPLSDFMAIPAGATMSVRTALLRYRSVYDNPSVSQTELSATLSGVYTQEVKKLLEETISKGDLILNQKSIIKVIREDNQFLALPIIKTAELLNGTAIEDLCEEIIPINAFGSSDIPEIVLGNEKFKALRMGLAQFNDLKTNTTKTLTVPVYSFTDADKTMSKDLTKITGNTSVLLVGTDDPSMIVNEHDPSIVVANIESLTATNGGANNNIKFKIVSPTFVPREGYTYSFEFHFNQVTGANDKAVCNGTGSLSIKIVPEYMTWTGIKGDNWNNDGNWVRSDKTELYKDVQNSDSYANYTSPLAHKGFVPMEFTKVIIPDRAAVDVYPWLYALSGSPLIMDNTNYREASDKLANSASADIEYDLAVYADGTNYNSKAFYGNTCAQIYFKPGAETRNTDVLSYSKAWIDFALSSNRWYMLASPLKGVVAGDMYLPASGGKQETEAFQHITYSTSLNNRFKPAVYQRSWDKTGSIVYKKDGTSADVRLTTAVNWSYVYNKVEEAYLPGKGFSIKPDNSINGDGDVLFRLPKSDNQYSYYSYDNSLTGGNPTNITRTQPGKLQLIGNQFDVSISNAAVGNTIFLVGNPFMCTIDMAKFFDKNTGFEKKFWILTANGQAATVFDNSVQNATSVNGGSVYLAPLQSFFVKSTGSGNSTTVSFTPEMTASRQAVVTLKSGSSENVEHQLSISALRNGKSSSILIVQRDNADNGFKGNEDVEILMDSNLADAPTLYSMAGNQAVMINVVESQKTIPLGVYSENNDDVVLSFDGLESFGGSVVLYDAVLRKNIILDVANSKVTVPGNTQERYYLNLSLTTGLEDTTTGEIIAYSPEKGKIVVAGSASDLLQHIQIYNVSGVLMRESSTINSVSTSFNLPDGMYFVRVQTNQLCETKKVYCR